MLSIIYEDHELLVINKPAGLVCHPTKGDAYSSLISRVRLHLGADARPHFVNRLDRETTGLVLIAKNADTAGELCNIWEKRSVDKIYLAIVKGHVPEEAGIIKAPLGKDEQSIVAIKNKVREDGAPATTTFVVLRRFTRKQGQFSLLAVQPLTGRKHQIRIHLAYRDHPIVGDKIYGGDERLYLAFVHGQLSESQRRELIFANHALHACEVRFRWRGGDFLFQAEPEPWFPAFALDEIGVWCNPSGLSKSRISMVRPTERDLFVGCYGNALIRAQ
jgi:23S rRNA pseudouridine1911/1915/1917 synthase